MQREIASLIKEDWEYIEGSEAPLFVQQMRNLSDGEHLEFYLKRGENAWPSAGAAAAELQHRNWAIAVNDMLARNQTLGGTVFSIGEKRGPGFAFADYLIDHEQWDQELFWAMRFLVPITQIYDRGG